MAQIQDNKETTPKKEAEHGRADTVPKKTAEPGREDRTETPRSGRETDRGNQQAARGDQQASRGDQQAARGDQQAARGNQQAARARKARRRKREAARRKRQRQIRLRMILLVVIIAAVAGVGISALLIHRRNVKEQEAALASSRRTAEEQAAFEATAEESALAASVMEEETAPGPTGKKTEDAGAQTSKKSEDAGTSASKKKAEEDAAKEASRKKAEEDAAREASRQKAEEEGALAASRKAAQERKEKEEAGKIPGLNESYDFKTTDETTDVPEDIDSEYALIVDLKKGTVIAGRDYATPINPASMTKVLTLLVAVENIDQSKLDTDTYEIHTGITDYVFTNQMSQVGFDIGDTPSIRSLLYGTILPSGADAALALAEYTAGSEEEFVGLMNKKLEELGISDTAHFTNVVGAFADDHYCSALDMATIMRAAIDNELCREVLSCRYYEVPRSLDEDAEVIEISNWFLRRIEDKDTHGTVVCGKTGFTNEAGNCAVSYQESDDGGHYICVTAQAPGGWPCIYDHVELYETFTN